MIAGQYLLAGHDCPDQSGYNDLEIPEGRSPGFFVLNSESKGICILVGPAIHTYIHYPRAEGKYHAEMLRLTEVEICAYSLFV